MKIFGFAFLPIGRRRMLDECPYCGHRGTTSIRRHHKLRKNTLSEMMDGFASDPDNPAHCCQALRTLMLYNEKSWFRDVRKSYGLRFETHMQVQLVIAQGLCRFGDYAEAILYCRKAIVLGAGKTAEDLLSFCQRVLETTKSKNNLAALELQPESARKAYIPIASIAAAITLFTLVQGITALRTNTAWLVNGSLQQYTFTLDEEIYTLTPGQRLKIKLRLGKHDLQTNPLTSAHQFTYSTSLFKQLIQKQLLVINPDAMALLTIEGSKGRDTYHSHSQQIHMLSGVGYSLFGLRKYDDAALVGNGISFYRPETHMAVVDHMNELEIHGAAMHYSRKALSMNPSSPEAPELLKSALNGADPGVVEAFLKKQLGHQPILLPWHLYYQNHVMDTQPTNGLIKEYTARCKDHPDEPKGYFLLGRVINNPSDARKFYLFSEKEGGMGGLGYYAIASDLFARGAFAEALPFSIKAIQANPIDIRFQHLHEQTLLALRKYDDLLASKELYENHSAEKDVLYLTCAGFHREAEEAANRYSEGSAQRLSELNAIRYYAVGNMDTYLHNLEEADPATAAFRRFIHENKISQADKMLSESIDHHWSDHLVLYCAALKHTEKDIAEYHLNKVFLGIDPHSTHQKRMAQFLQSKTAPGLEAIKELQIEAQEKALLCTILGYRFPEYRDEFHAAARSFNFNPSYPQILLRKWTQPTTKKTVQIKPNA
jgi:hypothetical protein